VEDWAELMGYNCPKKFARTFLRYYSVRPIISIHPTNYIFRVIVKGDSLLVKKR